MVRYTGEIMRRIRWIPASAPLALVLACSREPEPPAPPPAPPPEKTAVSPGGAEKIPPYHENEASAKPFPRLLDPEQFVTRPLLAKAYKIAATIPGVIAQQPCYCHCDALGHGSLLDCFASDHGAG